MAEPLLEVRNLHVSFPGTHREPARSLAVDGVDLTMLAGEVLALVGESGCGKTTLVRAVMGLVLPDAGEIRIAGATVGGSKRARRAHHRQVQMVFQDPMAALDPRHTVGWAVAEGLRIHKEHDRDARVSEALAEAGLRPPERFIDRYPHELSGGQRQRVVIAGAMVLSPRLLLADEPVASLDASVRGEILGLMRQLVDETGIGILAVTHDLGLAWNIADRVAVMYLGRIVEEGPAEVVLQQPQHPYTKALLSVVPETAHRRPQVLSGEIPDPRRIPPGCRFHPRCPLVQSGEAETSGIVTRCRTEVPELRTVGPEHMVACHAV